MKTGKLGTNWNSRRTVIYSKLNFRIVALVQMTTYYNTDNIPRESLWESSKMLYHQEPSHVMFRYMAHRRTQNLGCDIDFLYIKYRELKSFRVGLMLAHALLKEDADTSQGLKSTIWGSCPLLQGTLCETWISVCISYILEKCSSHTLGQAGQRACCNPAVYFVAHGKEYKIY